MSTIAKIIQHVTEASDRMTPGAWCGLTEALAGVEGITTVEEAERLLGNLIELDREPTACLQSYAPGQPFCCDRAEGHIGHHIDYTHDAPSIVAWAR
jgi:hypothetical protein